MGSETVKVKDLRELDRLVAVKVLGWIAPKRRTVGATWYTPSGAGASDSSIPRYSESIAAAWEVVERMRGEEFGVEIMDEHVAPGVPAKARAITDGWLVSFTRYPDGGTYKHRSLAVAASVAALRAKEVEVALVAPEAGDTETEP